MFEATEHKTAGMNMTVGAAFAGATALTLNQWVALATLIYFILQIGLLIPKYWALFKGKLRHGRH